MKFDKFMTALVVILLALMILFVIAFGRMVFMGAWYG